MSISNEAYIVNTTTGEVVVPMKESVPYLDMILIGFQHASYHSLMSQNIVNLADKVKAIEDGGESAATYDLTNMVLNAETKIQEEVALLESGINARIIYLTQEAVNNTNIRLDEFQTLFDGSDTIDDPGIINKIQSNIELIGNDSSGLIERLNNLESSVGMDGASGLIDHISNMGTDLISLVNVSDSHDTKIISIETILNTETTGIVSKVELLMGEVGGVSGNLTSLVNANDEILNGDAGVVIKLGNDSNGLVKKVNDLSDNFINLDVENNINTLITQNTNTSDSITTIESDVVNLKDSVNQNVSNLDTLIALDLSTLSDNVYDTTTGLSKLRTDVDDIISSRSSSTLSSDLSDLSDRVVLNEDDITASNLTIVSNTDKITEVSNILSNSTDGIELQVSNMINTIKDNLLTYVDADDNSIVFGGELLHDNFIKLSSLTSDQVKIYEYLKDSDGWLPKNALVKPWLDDTEETGFSEMVTSKINEIVSGGWDVESIEINTNDIITIKDDLTVIKPDLENVITLADEHDTRLNDIDSNLSDIATSDSEIRDLIATNTTNIDENQTKSNTNETDISDLKSDLTLVSDDVAVLKTDTSSALDEIVDIKIDINANVIKLDVHEDKITELNADSDTAGSVDYKISANNINLDTLYKGPIDLLLSDETVYGSLAYRELDHQNNIEQQLLYGENLDEQGNQLSIQDNYYYTKNIYNNLLLANTALSTNLSEAVSEIQVEMMRYETVLPFLKNMFVNVNTVDGISNEEIETIFDNVMQKVSDVAINVLQSSTNRDVSVYILNTEFPDIESNLSIIIKLDSDCVFTPIEETDDASIYFKMLRPDNDDYIYHKTFNHHDIETLNLVIESGVVLISETAKFYNEEGTEDEPATEFELIETLAGDQSMAFKYAYLNIFGEKVIKEIPVKVKLAIRDAVISAELINTDLRNVNNNINMNIKLDDYNLFHPHDDGTYFKLIRQSDNYYYDFDIEKVENEFELEKGLLISEIINNSNNLLIDPDDDTITSSVDHLLSDNEGLLISYNTIHKVKGTIKEETVPLTLLLTPKPASELFNINYMDLDETDNEFEIHIELEEGISFDPIEDSIYFKLIRSSDGAYQNFTIQDGSDESLLNLQIQLTRKMLLNFSDNILIDASDDTITYPINNRQGDNSDIVFYYNKIDADGIITEHSVLLDTYLQDRIESKTLTFTDSDTNTFTTDIVLDKLKSFILIDSEVDGIYFKLFRESDNFYCNYNIQDGTDNLEIEHIKDIKKFYNVQDAILIDPEDDTITEEVSDISDPNDKICILYRTITDEGTEEEVIQYIE